MIIAVGFENKEFQKLKEYDTVICASEDMRTWKVRDIIERAEKNGYCDKIKSSRIVIMHNVPSERISGLMKGIRSAVNKRIIFATTTPTSLDWSLDNLIAELEEEDAFFRGNR